MTQAAERLQKWFDENPNYIGKNDLARDTVLCEEIVKVVLNVGHPAFSTLEERISKAIAVELGISIQPAEKANFIARCILARTGLEHVSGQMYRVSEVEGSVMTGGDWLVRFNRKFSDSEWGIIASNGHNFIDPLTDSFSTEKVSAIVPSLLEGVEVVNITKRDGEETSGEMAPGM